MGNSLTELERLKILASYPYVRDSERQAPYEISIELTRYSDALAAGEKDCYKAIFICPCADQSFKSFPNPNDGPLEYLICDNCKRVLSLEEAGALINRYEVHLRRLAKQLCEEATSL